MLLLGPFKEVIEVYKVCVSKMFYDLRNGKKVYNYYEEVYKEKKNVIKRIKSLKDVSKYYDRILIKVSKGKDKKFFVFER